MSSFTGLASLVASRSHRRFVGSFRRQNPLSAHTSTISYSILGHNCLGVQGGKLDEWLLGKCQQNLREFILSSHAASSVFVPAQKQYFEDVDNERFWKSVPIRTYATGTVSTK
jgi:hypothetical protein